MWIVQLFLILNAVVCAVAHSVPPYGRNNYHLTNLAINGTALSITGLTYDESVKVPLWVEHTFGSKAIFWKDLQWVTQDAMPTARSNFLRASQLPSDAFFSPCSLSLIGFVRQGIAAPFRGKIDRRNDNPPMGRAMLRSEMDSSDSGQWTCYYRALYTNWREIGDNPDSFWNVMIFCPSDGNIKNKISRCRNFKQMHHEGPAAHTLTMLLRDGTEWHAKFSTVKSAASKQTLTHEFWNEPVAVCTAWVYSTNQPDKVPINQALVYEFLRYYANLGMKIFVYDRDGAGIKGVFDSHYAKANPQRGSFVHAIDRSLVYHNYTIHSLLRPDLDVSTFDMNGATRKTVAWFDNDKDLTYTQCRFEAQAKYGINRVIVIDFDEFLFCKDVPATPHEQSKFLDQYLNSLLHTGYDQIMFGKTTVAGKASADSDMASCVQTVLDEAEAIATSTSSSGSIEPSPHAKNSQQGSIYKCFASIGFVDSKPNPKSVHLNYACPFTNMHHACGGCKINDVYCAPKDMMFSCYDCACDTIATEVCDFVHLSVMQDKYTKEFDRAAVAKKQSELWTIANAHG